MEKLNELAKLMVAKRELIRLGFREEEYGMMPNSEFEQLQRECDIFKAGMDWRFQNEWISLKHTLPVVGSRSLLFAPAYGLEREPVALVGTRMEDHPNPWWHCTGAIWAGLETFTHWMAIPEWPSDRRADEKGEA